VKKSIASGGPQARKESDNKHAAKATEYLYRARTITAKDGIVSVDFGNQCVMLARKMLSLCFMTLVDTYSYQEDLSTCPKQCALARAPEASSVITIKMNRASFNQTKSMASFSA
jgi:hypothetical protein